MYLIRFCLLFVLLFLCVVTADISRKEYVNYMWRGMTAAQGIYEVCEDCSDKDVKLFTVLFNMPFSVFENEGRLDLVYWALCGIAERNGKPCEGKVSLEEFKTMLHDYEALNPDHVVVVTRRTGTFKS